MNTADHVLSFATDTEGQVFVHANAEGLDHLIASLGRLRDRVKEGESDHDHFMTPSWGGNELTERTLAESSKELATVHHVKIYAWPQEWVKKHQLLV